jgi:hypothetical protein
VFADTFAQCMQGSGAAVGAGVVTDQASFAEAVKYVKNWLDGIDGTAKQALDDASTHPEGVAIHLVGANVAPSLEELMKAFDQTSGMPLSTFLDWCIYCADQAATQGGS